MRQGSSSYETSTLYLLGPGCQACAVILLEREPDTDEYVMEDLGRFGGVGTEKTDEVEAVGREGVVEVKGHLLTGEPACYPTVHLEIPEHLTDLWKLANIKVWLRVGRELDEALQ